MSKWLLTCQRLRASPLSDSVFIIDRSLKPPDLLVSFARLLQLPPNDWRTTREKSKLPKPRMDVLTSEICKNVLQARLREYSTTLEVGYRA